MILGKYTWYFFHTFAEKIKEDKFYSHREILFSIIKDTCSVLPCPNCRSHAIASLKNVNWDNIKTKTDFKSFLFNFHNIINKRKRFNV